MRRTRPSLQTSRPLFVRIPFMASGTYYEKGDEFPYHTLKVEMHKVEKLFKQGILHHNEEREEKSKGTIGDGLDQLTLAELHELVDGINDTVKQKAKNETEFKRKKCPKSPSSLSKQMGYIRRWRMTYGDME